MSETLSDEQINDVLGVELHEFDGGDLVRVRRALRELQRLRAATGPTRAQIEALPTLALHSEGFGRNSDLISRDAVLALFKGGAE
jgi:hypothetical protein